MLEDLCFVAFLIFGSLSQGRRAVVRPKSWLLGALPDSPPSCITAHVLVYPSRFRQMWTLRAKRECAMSSEEQPRRLMVQHVDDKVVTNNCMLFELTEMNDQDICAVDGRERSAWDQSPTHLKHTGVSPPRGRCHARAANTRPFSLGRRHARPESSKSCTEAEQAYMLSARVRLGVRSQRTWWALHIGPVRRNRGQEFMVMSTWNDGTISAPAGTDRTRLTTVSVYMWFIVSGTALGVCHRRHHLRRHLHHHPHHLHQILRPLLRQNLRSTPHRQLRHRRLHQPHFRHPPSLLLVCAPCPAPGTPPSKVGRAGRLR